MTDELGLDGIMRRHRIGGRKQTAKEWRKKQDPLWSCFGLSEEVPILRMRALVQPADRDAVWLHEDPAFGMGGVPAPPLRFPFRQNVGPGQQKRRKRRKILACEGILRQGKVPRRGVLAGRVWLDETFVKVDARDRQSKGLRDNKKPMDNINDVHDKLKRFLRSHGGYARKDLQGWLNLFWFIWSEPRNRYEKTARLIKIAISANKVIRYRDLYGKKDWQQGRSISHVQKRTLN